MPDVNELTELMNVFRNQTPSSPAWYQVIDTVVGTLLQIELNRAVDEASYTDLRASGGIQNAPPKLGS
jgi:hypothetical protein